MKYLRLFITDTWRLAAIGAGGLFVLCSVLLFKLGSLTSGLDATEAHAQEAVLGHNLEFIELLRQGVNLPHNLGLFLLQYQPFHGAGSLRLLSVSVAIAAAVSLFYILYTWHTPRLAILGTTMFATASWQLHVARYGSPECLYLLPLVLLACWTWLQSKQFTRPAMITLTVAGCLCLYVPGLLWFAIPVIVIQRKRLKQSLRYVPLETVVFSQFLALLLIAPLILSLVWPVDNTTTVHNLLAMLGLPASIPGIGTYLHNLGAVPSQIFYQLGATPHLGIKGIPLLDMFTSAMFLLGSFVFLRDWRLDRSKLILLYMLVGWLLVAAGGAVSITILLPVLIVVAAEGVAYMLIEWLTIFPKNPVAGSVGVAIVTVAVCISASYNLASYFVAWPHTTEVTSSFTRQP
jgi:hypothetical protein